MLVETARRRSTDIYEEVVAQLNQLQIGATEIDGLLVMCNRTDVLGALATYPESIGWRAAYLSPGGHLSSKPRKVSWVETMWTQKRANVRFTRVSQSMTLLSPKDITNLLGAFQVLATYLHVSKQWLRTGRMKSPS